MSQNKEKIFALSWKIFRLMRQRLRNDDLNDILNMNVSELLDEVEKSPNLKDVFSWHDLFELFNAPLSIRVQRELFRINTKRKLQNYVKKYILKQPGTFNFYFKFGMMGDFRTGYQLGDGVFFSFEKLPQRVKRFIKQNMPYERAKYHYPTISKRDWIRRRKRDTYMKISVVAIGSEKAKQKAFAKLRRNHNVLKLVIGNNVRSTDRPTTPFFYYMHDSQLNMGQLSEGHKSEIHIWKPRDADAYIKKINVLFNKQNPTELEKRILNAIDVYGLIESDTPLNVRFLLCIIGLESLFLGKDDRDYLGMKIAEKVSFLLAGVKWWQKEIYKIPFHRYDKIDDEFVKKHLLESRIKLHEKMKEFYNKRSAFAHSGHERRNKMITENDYVWAANFLRWSIELVLPMTKKFTHIAKKNETDKKFLDQYFQNLKYS